MPLGHTRAARLAEFPARLTVISAVSVLALVIGSVPAAANVPLTQISFDTFTNPTSQHKTQVEPDTFQWGSTIVSVFQTGRFFDGGASAIAFATSTNGGATWTTGALPGITVHQGGPYDRVSDPVVAFDPEHNVWLASTLAISEAGGVHGVGVLTSRSTDGGLSWSGPIVVSPGDDPDKNWIACDTWAGSPFFGNCYTQWDDFGNGNRIRMSTSTDGGLTWGPGLTTQDNATGIGGQPVVQPNGTVIVPMGNAFLTQVRAFRSTNGGASWTRSRKVANINEHVVAGSLRTPPLPSAEVDASGKVYVAWHDCRFRSGCSANDIVMSTSTNGTSWTAVTRLTVGTGDYFIPGIGVDRSSSGGTTRIGLTFHTLVNPSCTSATCQLTVAYQSSTNGGASWSAQTQLAGPMTVTWLANTTQGRMFGDYISTSVFEGGNAYPVISVANAPAGGMFDQASYVPTGGLAVTGGLVAATTRKDGADLTGTARIAQR